MLHQEVAVNHLDPYLVVEVDHPYLVAEVDHPCLEVEVGLQDRLVEVVELRQDQEVGVDHRHQVLEELEDLLKLKRLVVKLEEVILALLEVVGGLHLEVMVVLEFLFPLVEEASLAFQVEVAFLVYWEVASLAFLEVVAYLLEQNQQQAKYHQLNIRQLILLTLRF